MIPATQTEARIWKRETTQQKGKTMKTPTQILTEIAKQSPSVAIQINWTHDEDSRWSEIAESMAGEDPDNWQAWNSEIEAIAIIGGKAISGNARLSGTWEKYGDNPRQNNPDISGYFPQMVQEALEDLKKQLPGICTLHGQIGSALGIIKREMQARYDETSDGLNAAKP